MLAPIIPFTSDEAWCLIPEVISESVHLATWPKREKPAANEKNGFDLLMDLSSDVLKTLETARQNKEIGKSLDAKVILRAGSKTMEHIRSVGGVEPFREFLNVSQLQVSLLEDVSEKDQIIVAKADGQKCERCWRWETDVGASAEHPTICGRCVKAVEEVMAGR
jgi:isoleucyl-tRNA synthetase